MAFFGAAGYGIATGVPTYVDPRLHSHINGAISYPLGLWVLVPIPFIFGAIWLAETRIKNKLTRLVVTGACGSALGILSLFNFWQKPFHLHVIQWSLLYGICGIITFVIRHSILTDSRLFEPSISRSARIERIKEYVQSWRTCAIALGGGYATLVITWVTFMERDTERFVLNVAERNFAVSVFQGEIWFYSLFVILGPITEAFRKMSEAGNLLYLIKEEEHAIEE